MVKQNDDYLAELVARRMLGLPLEGELNLPSEKEIAQPSAQIPQQQALPINLPESVPVTQAPSAPITTAQEEGWLPTIGKAIGAGLLTPLTGATGTLSAIGGRLGIDTSQLRHLASELESKLTPKVGKSKAKKYTYAILHSTINSIAQFFVSRYTGIPLLPMFGVTSGGEKYLQLREAGVPHTKALQSAIPTGLSEALTEKLPYEAMFKDVGKPLVRRLLKMFGGEILGEDINTLVEDITDTVALKQHKTLQDYVNDVIETTIVSFGQTLLTGGLGLGLQRLAKKPKREAVVRKATEKPRKTEIKPAEEKPAETAPDYSQITAQDLASELASTYESFLEEVSGKDKRRVQKYIQTLKNIAEEKPSSIKDLQALQEELQNSEFLDDISKTIFKYHIESLIEEQKAKEKKKEKEEKPKEELISKEEPLKETPEVTGETKPTTKELISEKETKPEKKEIKIRKPEVKPQKEELVTQEKPSTTEKKTKTTKKELISKEEPESEEKVEAEVYFPVTSYQRLKKQKDVSRKAIQLSLMLEELGIKEIGDIDEDERRGYKIRGTREQIEALKKKVKRRRIVVEESKPKETAKPEEGLDEKTKGILRDKGFTESQITKLKPAEAKKLIDENLTPEDVSILKDGTVKVISKEKKKAKEFVEKPISEKEAEKKELWQMTREEFASYLYREKAKRQREIAEKEGKKIPVKGRGSTAGLDRWKYQQVFLEKAERFEQFAREPKKHKNDTEVIRKHIEIIERALKEGKPVPKEVLKDYPDLEKKIGEEAKPKKKTEKLIPGEKVKEKKETKELISGEKPAPEGFTFEYTDKNRNAVKPKHSSITDIPFVIKKSYKGWKVFAEKPIKLKDGTEVTARQERGKFKTLAEAKQFVKNIVENKESVFEEDKPLLDSEGNVIKPADIDFKHFEKVSQVLGKEKGKEIKAKPKKEKPISELEDEVEKITKEVENEEDILKKLWKKQGGAPEEYLRPALIPGHPAKTISARRKEFKTPKQRAKLFKSSIKVNLKEIFMEVPLEHEIRTSYGRFEEEWTKTTAKGKSYILNVGRPKFVLEAYEKGEIKDSERTEYDFLISALEWVNGTNFKDYIKKGLITEEEAKSRIKFFDTYPERVLRFETEWGEGFVDIFRKWARGDMYKSNPEETEHIASLIADAKDPEFRYIDMDLLLNPTKKTRNDVMFRISRGLAYVALDRFMEKARRLQSYSLETIKSQLKKYALGIYVQALEKREDSPLIQELLKTGVTKEEAFKLVENSHYQLYLRALDDYWNISIKQTMGFYKEDTPLSWAGELFKWVWDVIQTKIYFENSTAGKQLREDLNEFIRPFIRRFIRAGDRIKRVSTDIKHVVLLQTLMQKLDTAIEQYLNGEINVENTQRILARYWKALIERYAEGNHKILAKMIAEDVFSSSIKDGVYRLDLRDIDRYRYLDEGYKLFVENHPDAYSALVYLSRNGSSGDVREVANTLLKLAYTHVILPNIPVTLDTEVYKRGATGVYAPSKNTFGEIRIDPYLPADNFESSLFHEILHALTLHTINFSPEANKHRNKIYEIVKDIRKLISKEEYELGKFIEDNAGKLSAEEIFKKANELAEKDKSLQKHIAQYGRESWLVFLRSLHSPDEFIVTAISEPTIREFLVENDARSIWRKILDAIKNLLGIPTEEANLFVRTIDSLLDIVDTSHPRNVLSFRLRYNLSFDDRLRKLAKASTQDLVNLAKQVINQVELEHKRISLRDFGGEVLKDFMFQLKNYTPPPQMKDINEVRKKFGLPFWTALEYPSFKPLFDHVNRVMENKNFLLHDLLEAGEKYFTQVDERRRKYVDSAIKFSDAFQVYLTDEQLKNLPQIISKVRIAFNQMYYLLQKEEKENLTRLEKAKRRQAVLNKLNKDTGLELPKEYSQPQHIIRFKHFFDYAKLPLDSLTQDEIEAYHNYREITQKTINHIADTFLTLVSRIVIEDYLKSEGIEISEPNKIMLINRLFEFGKDMDTARETIEQLQDEEAKAMWDTFLSNLENHSLFRKYLDIRELADKTIYYSPRFRDPDASDMIVVVDKQMFMDEYRKAYRKYQNREKALQLAYQATANNNGVYLRQHVKRYDPDYSKKLEHIRNVFKDERFLIRRLPNYKLAESVYGNISEGDIGAFLSAVAEKAKAGKVDNKALMEILDSVAGAIQQELMAKSRATQRFIHRNPYLILGYDLEDTKEDTFNYINNATNYTARLMALFDGLPLLNKIDPYQQRNLRDYAHKWFFDQLKPQSRFDRIVGKVKSYMFIWYLGGMIRPALVQATQMFISAIPLASTVFNLPLRRSLSLFMKAYKDILPYRDLDKNPNLTEDERKFLQITYNSGVTTAQFINQMKDEITGRGKAFTKLANALATPFAYMEEANRLATALGIYRLLKSKGMVRFPTDRRAITEATDFINMTHYLMGKLNLPPIATGGDLSSGIARLALTFRSFTLNLLESYNYMLRHYVRSRKSLFGLNKKGLEFVGYSMLAFALFGGLFAIPFLDDILQLIERLTGTPLRKNIVKMVGDPDSPLAISVERGLPASLFGIDLSGSLKIEAPKRPADLLNAVFGVYGGLAKSFADALVALDGYDSINVLFRALPQFLANPLKAYEAYKGLRNAYNKPILDENGQPIRLTEGEALLLALGIRPTRLGRTYFYKSTSRNIDMYFANKRKEIYNKFRSARTPAERFKVMKMIAEYNKEASKFVSVPKITITSLKTVVKPVRDKLAQELKAKGL